MSKEVPSRCNAAVSFELKEGTGAITRMCSCGDFLEIYKIDKTFRVQSPESIDPEGTNPDAPWVTTPVSNVGSQHPIVARILLQSDEILRGAWFERDVDKTEVIQRLHSCKEDLLVCDRIAKKIATEVDKIILRIKTEGISKEERANGFNPFPHVNELNTDCATFLTKARHAITAISGLPAVFFKLNNDDNNFDSLVSTLTPMLEKNSPLLDFITLNAEDIKYIVELRNFQEHPKKDKKTVIENFRCTPDTKIVVPQWHITGNEKYCIKEDMESIVNYLLEIAEAMFLHLTMATVTREIPFIIERIEESKIDPEVLIRYKLSIDFDRLNLPK